jgi:hypothetical protein
LGSVYNGIQQEKLVDDSLSKKELWDDVYKDISRIDTRKQLLWFRNSPARERLKEIAETG